MKNPSNLWNIIRLIIGMPFLFAAICCLWVFNLITGEDLIL